MTATKTKTCDMRCLQGNHYFWDCQKKANSQPFSVTTGDLEKLAFVRLAKFYLPGGHLFHISQ